MYIHLGRDYVLNDRDIIGIFNLETTTISPRGREFLNYAQKNGAVVSLSDELPQSYVLADGGVVDRLLVSGTMALSDASARADAMVCTPFTSLPTTGSMAATFQTGEESSSFMAFAEDCRLEAFFAAVAKSCPAMAV